MADYIEVDITTLEQDIDELKETLRLAKNGEADMFETIKELDAMWEGPAHEAFSRQFTADRQILQAFLDNVEGMVESMENAKNSYRKCEASVRTEIEKIKI